MVKILSYLNLQYVRLSLLLLAILLLKGKQAIYSITIQNDISIVLIEYLQYWYSYHQIIFLTIEIPRKFRTKKNISSFCGTEGLSCSVTCQISIDVRFLFESYSY